MRKRFKANGNLFYGTITEIKKYKSTGTAFIGRRAHEVEVTRYTYVAKYINGNNEEKEVESYIMSRANRDAVGKNCTIYECEGKTLMDAIEVPNHV